MQKSGIKNWKAYSYYNLLSGLALIGNTVGSLNREGKNGISMEAYSSKEVVIPGQVWCMFTMQRGKQCAVVASSITGDACICQSSQSCLGISSGANPTLSVCFEISFIFFKMWTFVLLHRVKAKGEYSEEYKKSLMEHCLVLTGNDLKRINVIKLCDSYFKALHFVFDTLKLYHGTAVFSAKILILLVLNSSWVAYTFSVAFLWFTQ